MRIFTVRFDDGTETKTTGDRSWYADKMEDTPDEVIVEKFRTVGCVHTRHFSHGRLMGAAEFDALREPVEVIAISNL